MHSLQLVIDLVIERVVSKSESRVALAFRLFPDTAGPAIPVKVDVLNDSIATASISHPLQFVADLVMERVVSKVESRAALAFRLSPDPIGVAIPISVDVPDNPIATALVVHPLQLVVDLVIERVISRTSELRGALAFRLSPDTIGAAIPVEADVSDNSIATALVLHPLQVVVDLIMEPVVSKPPASRVALAFRLSPDTIGAAIPVEPDVWAKRCGLVCRIGKLPLEPFI